MAGFVFLRVRAHRLLLAATLLTVLLTTAVLATLGAFGAAIGDAGLRHALRVATDLPESERAAAERTFDGLPVTLRSMAHSGKYALPRELQSAAARQGEPDLTLFAAIDRTHVTLTTGAWPDSTARGPAESDERGANAKNAKNGENGESSTNARSGEAGAALPSRSRRPRRPASGCASALA